MASKMASVEAQMPFVKANATFSFKTCAASAQMSQTYPILEPDVRSRVQLDTNGC